MQTLVRLQRKVMRIITHSSWNACVDQLFKSTKIMEIQEIYVYKVAMIMFSHNAINVSLKCPFFNVRYLLSSYEHVFIFVYLNGR